MPQRDERPVLEGGLARLRPATEADAPRLAEILARPEVAAWWDVRGEERVRRELIDPAGGAFAFAIEADDAVVGLVQYWEADDPAYRHAGIDVFLDPDRHGRGIGADAVRTLARHLFADRGHHRLTIDPAADNERAIRSYARVGFRPVGVLRRYWRDHEGRWRDGLLMDLLPEDLV
jgi:aminoglycoside 6'-N-acetyltransferase